MCVPSLVVDEDVKKPNKQTNKSQLSHSFVFKSVEGIKQRVCAKGRYSKAEENIQEEFFFLFKISMNLL